MPYRPNPRRPLPVQLSALQLTGSIALGMWLGFLAIALTCWLLSRLVFTEQLAPVAQAVQQLAQPPAAVQAQPDIPPQSPLFDQYEENLRKNEQQIAIASIESVIAESYKGGKVRIVAGSAKRPPHFIIAQPEIKSLADLKGKQLAIDMGGSQFQVVKMYATAKGIDLGKDITVVNANFAVARAQLEAGRVDAALVIEPLASIIAKQNPDWHVIFNGAEGWKDITGEAGWEIVPAMRADAIQRVPDGPKMLLAALADVADVMQKDTASADKIANDTLKLPPGILTAAVESKRLQMIVKPAWDPETKKSITDMMERAVKAGFYEKMPDAKIMYAP